MDFLSDHWGGLASVIGVVVSVIGLAWAIIEASRARSAAQSAEQIAEEVKLEAFENTKRHLLMVDIERAIDLIQRLKLLHIIGRWDAALEQYQALRWLVSSIIPRCPELEDELRGRLSGARLVIRDIENTVASPGRPGLNARVEARFTRRLNEIQSDLEDVATEVGGP